MRYPQDQVVKETNLIHIDGVVDMDVIPSLVIEPVIPTIVEEQEK
jgi:hypothetical protein